MLKEDEEQQRLLSRSYRSSKRDKSNAGKSKKSQKGGFVKPPALLLDSIQAANQDEIDDLENADKDLKKKGQKKDEQESNSLGVWGEIIKLTYSWAYTLKLLCINQECLVNLGH